MVICLEQGADLHMAQLMPMPLTVSCFSKIQIGFTFLVPAHLGSPGQRAVKQACVCVCVFRFLRMPTMQHCPHSHATHCCRAAISQYLMQTGPTAANLRPCQDTQTTLRILDGQWQQMKTEWWLTHSQVESISLNQIGQFVEQVSSVCSIHASPWRSQSERITCCLNGFVNVGLDTTDTARWMVHSSANRQLAW